MAADSLVKASTPEPFSASKTSNWVARGGGLPPYIQHVAHDIMEKRGKSESEAIQIAIGVVKRWAMGGGKVDATTQAAAKKALAEWEALKAKSHVKEAVVSKPTGALAMVLTPEQVGSLTVREAAGVTVNGMTPGRTAGQQLAARGRKPAAAKTRSGGSAAYDPSKHPKGRGGKWVIKAGATGQDVRAIQRRVGGLKVDGQFGPKTAAAIRAFQRRHGLEVDGVAGHQTITALAGHYAAARKATPGAIKMSDRAKLAKLRGHKWKPKG